MCATQDGHIDVVNTLLQYGATVDKASRVRVVDEVDIQLQ